MSRLITFGILKAADVIRLRKQITELTAVCALLKMLPAIRVTHEIVLPANAYRSPLLRPQTAVETPPISAPRTIGFGTFLTMAASLGLLPDKLNTPVAGNSTTSDN
jgi:hypothetical protein